MASAADEVKQDVGNINFGKRLAHTDKIVRDRGFKALQKWLQKHPNLERADYMKLWKGLYFCMWMSDKRPVQQELCVNIALLINDVPVEKQELWIETWWETMMTAWEQLDRHRMNKYLLFARIVIAEAFKVLRVNGWDMERAKRLGGIFTTGASDDALSSNATCVLSLGFFIQFLRLFWAELTPQLKLSEEVPSACVMALLESFCVVAETSPVRNLVQAIHTSLLRQAPKALHAALIDRLLLGASKKDMFQSSRELFYETADVLEKEARKAMAPPKVDAPKRKPYPKHPEGSKKERKKVKHSAFLASKPAVVADVEETDAAAKKSSKVAVAKSKGKGLKRKAEVAEPAEPVAAEPAPVAQVEAAEPAATKKPLKKKLKTKGSK